tara:strand:+ start:2500 stop:3288 length:789 start_codon:yes stop_codon:yes gene_type:complete
LNLRGFLLFDIDGVIRDVTGSYRLAIQKTVSHFCLWEPSLSDIDKLKMEGSWNNDWNASLELIKRFSKKKGDPDLVPSLSELIIVFNNFYFGGNPNSDSKEWTGLIRNEPLLIEPAFFKAIEQKGFVFGFVSGAEAPSAKFVLETRLLLQNPPLIAMGEAPEKPDPTGLLKLSRHLAGRSLGKGVPPIAYLGDTVADILTIKNAQESIPNQTFISFAVSPPHLHKKNQKANREIYEKTLKEAGADKIIPSTKDLIKELFNFF